ncbi:MAG: putative glycosyltransferase EpsJ [Candidatus Erwinia impunctatus]|nr:putative glycosyltransferase EpsJ [Culicoides impunctatus]
MTMESSSVSTAPDTLPSPVLSIIVPMFNAEKSFPSFISSLLAQTQPNIEVIIVNDGSTDDSAVMAHRYAQQYDHITVIDQPNRGVSCARNAGMAIARGTYVTFPDADDTMEPEMYQTLVTMAQRDDLDVAQCNAVRVFLSSGRRKTLIPVERLSSTGILTGTRWLSQALATNRYLHVVWLGIYRRSLIERIGLQFEPGLHHQDIPWTTELMINAQRVRYTDTILYHYYVHNQSISHQPRTGKSNVIYQRHYLKIAQLLDDINLRYQKKTTLYPEFYRQVTREALCVCHAVRRETDIQTRQAIIQDIFATKTPQRMLRNVRGLRQWYQLLLWLARLYRWRGQRLT